MARPVSTTLTKSEHAILDVLWNRGEASVRDVADELSKHKPVAYTTALTMLGVLHKKGLVTHRPEGRAFIYRAAITRDEARTRALSELLAQFFDGSANVLAQHLVAEHEIDRAELDALRRRVDAAKQKGKP
jgi:predicted transcriptional regulator